MARKNVRITGSGSTNVFGNNAAGRITINGADATNTTPSCPCGNTDWIDITISGSGFTGTCSCGATTTSR